MKITKRSAHFRKKYEKHRGFAKRQGRAALESGMISGKTIDDAKKDKKGDRSRPEIN